MMQELINRGPVAVGITVPQSFEEYRSGIYIENKENDPSYSTFEPTGHAVLVVGYGVENGTKYWRVRNSWGRHFGETGYFRVRRGTDEISIESMAISTDMARQVREILEEVMTDGTGRQSQSERYRLFGKSGTAQLPKVQGGGYHEDRYISSFIAGAPFSQPEVVVLCVIDDPDRSLGAWYGGRVAGPVTRDVIDFTLEYMGVAPDKMPEGMALGNSRTN